MSGDVIMSARDKFKSGILDFDRVVLFTPDPPPGEECFTIAKISDIKNFPAGITNEAYIGQNARVTRHELKWKGGAESISFIFGRVELGWKAHDACTELVKVSDYYWNQLRQAKGEAYEAYCAVVQHFHENLPVNTSFAEITPGARHVPQALDFGRTARGEITAREELSDLDFVPASPAEKADNTGSSSTLPGFAGRPGVTDENGDTITSGNFYSQIPGVEPFNCVDLDRCASPNKKVRVATVNPERRQETPSKFIGSAGSSAASQSSSDAGQKGQRMTEADLFDDDDEVMDETYTPPEPLTQFQDLNSEINEDEEDEFLPKIKMNFPKRRTRQSAMTEDQLLNNTTVNLEDDSFEGEDDDTGKENLTPSNSIISRTRSANRARSDAEAGRAASHAIVRNLHRAQSLARAESLFPSSTSKATPSTSKATPSTSKATPSTSKASNILARKTLQEIKDSIERSKAEAAAKATVRVTKKASRTPQGRPRKERVETPEDDENEGDEFDNADDNSKCGPECQCNSKTINELKAGMPGPAWHAMTCFIQKTLHGIQAGIANIRREQTAQKKRSSEMSEEIQSVKSFAKAAAIKATAVQQEENDLVLLGVPWTAIEDCVDAVSSPEKRLAIGRLCCGKLISKNQAHIVSDLFTTLFHEDMHGLLYSKLDKGDNGLDRVVRYGQELHLLPANFISHIIDQLLHNCEGLTKEAARSKINNHLSDARQKRKRKEVNFIKNEHDKDKCHTMYELLYMSMLMDDQLIDEPCPKPTATDEEKSAFVDKYFDLVTQNYETWSKLLYRQGGTEEEVLAKLLGKHAVRGKGRRSKENDQ